MSKFHINKHGVPAPCKAKPGNCPLGGDETHFNSLEEAQVAINRINEEEHGIIPGMKTKPKEEVDQTWNQWQIEQFKHEIEWLKKEIEKGVTAKQKREYVHQIRKKELEIAFNEKY